MLLLKTALERLTYMSSVEILDGPSLFFEIQKCHILEPLLFKYSWIRERKSEIQKKEKYENRHNWKLPLIKSES